MAHQIFESLSPQSDHARELTLLSPERQAALRFGEALQQYSSDDPAAEEAELGCIVDAAVGSAVHPDLKQVYQLTGGILRWQLFRQDAELPPGLLWMQQSKGGVVLDTDARVVGHRNDYDDAIHALDKLGLAQLLERRVLSRQKHYETLVPFFTDVLGQTPTGRLLLAHAHALPDSQAEQLLPEHVRLARERKLWEAQGPNAHLDPTIRAALRRPIGRLSVEVIDAPEYLNETPLERLRGELNERIGKYLNSLGIQPRGPVHIDERGRLEMESDHGPRDGHEFAEALHGNDNLLQPRARLLLYAEYKLMEAIFKAPRTASCLQILEASARESLLGDSGYGHLLTVNEHAWGLDYAGYTHEVSGQIVPVDAKPPRRIDPLYTKIPHAVTHIPTEQDLTDAKRRVIGTVQNMHLQHAQGYRLMLHQDRKYREMDGPDGDISITLKQLAGFEPFVPGYETVSVRRQGDDWRFGLRYTGEDPYVSCPIVIPREGAERLANVFSDFDLHDIADGIMAQADLTVSQFTALLQHSFRPLEISWCRDFRRSTDLAGMLKQCVRKGEIAVVCQQAAGIVRESLHIAFGRPCAQTLMGSVFAMQGGTLDSVAHEQVATFLDGHLYMLDASPGLPPVTTASDARPPIVANDPPQQVDSIPAAEALGSLLRSQEETTRAADAERTLYEQLQTILAVPTTEAVHARLQSRHRRDIAAQAIGCLLDLHAHDSSSVAPTLALLKAANETTMRTDPFGVHRYPRFVIDSMRYAVETARHDS